MKIIKNRIVFLLVILSMVVSLMPYEAFAGDVVIDEGMLDVPEGQQGTLSYPINATKILQDGTNFFGNPEEGFYVLEDSISDGDMLGANLVNYNLIVKNAKIQGSDVPWYLENVKIWQMKGNTGVTTFSNGIVEGRGFDVNGGNLIFENIYMITDWNINGGNVVISNNTLGTGVLNICGGDVSFEGIGSTSSEWTGDININGGYVSIKDVEGFGGSFTSSSNATVLVYTKAHDTRFDGIGKGILFKGNEGTTKGDLTLRKDLTIQKGEKLVIPKGAVLRLGENVTLNNLGEIICNGEFDQTAANSNLIGNQIVFPEIPDTKPDVKPDIKPDTKPDTKPDIKPETPDTKPDTKPDNTPVYPPTQDPVYPPIDVPLEPQGDVPVYPPTAWPKEPEYFVPKMPVRPLYGVGSNIGMDERQQDVCLEIMKDTIEKNKDKLEYGNAIRNGEKVSVRLLCESLRNSQDEKSQEALKLAEAKLNQVFGGLSHYFINLYDISLVCDVAATHESVAKKCAATHESVARYEVKQESPMSLTVLLAKRMPYGARGEVGVVKVCRGKVTLLTGEQVDSRMREGVVRFAMDENAIYGIFCYERLPESGFRWFEVCKRNRNTLDVLARGIRVGAKDMPKGIEYNIAYKVKGSKVWKAMEYSESGVRRVRGIVRGRKYVFAIRYRYVDPLDEDRMVYSKVWYCVRRFL